jgi:hypothetical protein
MAPRELAKLTVCVHTQGSPPPWDRFSPSRPATWQTRAEQLVASLVQVLDEIGNILAVQDHLVGRIVICPGGVADHRRDLIPGLTFDGATGFIARTALGPVFIGGSVGDTGLPRGSLLWAACFSSSAHAPVCGTPAEKIIGGVLRRSLRTNPPGFNRYQVLCPP